ncbi:MAG: exo-alpha-sialidase [Pirellulales bacterium]|nr:exo-alpha-sialidase [Pirellulales bacterium]
MKTRIPLLINLILIVAMLTVTAPNIFAAEKIEDTLAVKVKKGLHGPRGMPGDFVQLKDGTLLMSYTKDGSIMGIKSKDGGKTWGESFVLVPGPKPPADGYYCHPSFLRLKDGQILLAYNYSTHPRTPYFAQVYIRRSADEGKTWTDQYCITPHPGYVLVHNDKLFKLSSGRIVATGEYKAHMPSTHDHSGYVGIAFFSDDDGYTWQVSKNVVDMMPVEVQEADGVELKDGRVMMFARTYSGYPVRAYSKDGCKTWSKGEPIKQLRMPYAGLPTVRRIPSTGDLLFIWISERSQDKDNPKIHRRCELSSAISKDEGKTFVHQRKIVSDPEDDFGYQAIEFLGDKTAVLAYHARDGLHVARIPIDWFYGK